MRSLIGFKRIVFAAVAAMGIAAQGEVKVVRVVPNAEAGEPGRRERAYAIAADSVAELHRKLPIGGTGRLMLRSRRSSFQAGMSA